MSLLPDIPPLFTVEVDLPDIGTQRIDIRDFTEFRQGYEDEMREQPDRYAYIDAVKVELDALIEEKEAEFKAWQGQRREEISEDVAKRLGKKKAAVADLDSALHSDPAYLPQLKLLISLRKQSKKLSGWLKAMVQRERMLGHLAQQELRGLSSYSHRGVRFGSQADRDQEAEYNRKRQKFCEEQLQQEQ